MSHYIASFKGSTAGMHLTPRAAADDFFNKYRDARECVVAGVKPGPGNTVIYTYGAPRIKVKRKEVSKLEGAPLWRA